MTYKVLMRFADMQDGNRVYEVGDIFPRPGLDVSPERLAELAGSDNRIGKPIIKAENTPEPEDSVERAETPVEAPIDEPKEIPDEPAETPQKGRRTRNKG